MIVCIRTCPMPVFSVGHTYVASRVDVGFSVVWSDAFRLEKTKICEG